MACEKKRDFHESISYGIRRRVVLDLIQTYLLIDSEQLQPFLRQCSF